MLPTDQASEVAATSQSCEHGVRPTLTKSEIQAFQRAKVRDVLHRGIGESLTKSQAYLFQWDEWSQQPDRFRQRLPFRGAEPS